MTPRVEEQFKVIKKICNHGEDETFVEKNPKYLDMFVELNEELDKVIKWIEEDNNWEGRPCK